MDIFLELAQCEYLAAGGLITSNQSLVIGVSRSRVNIQNVGGMPSIYYNVISLVGRA